MALRTNGSHSPGEMGVRKSQGQADSPDDELEELETEAGVEGAAAFVVVGLGEVKAVDDGGGEDDDVCGGTALAGVKDDFLVCRRCCLALAACAASAAKQQEGLCPQQL